MTVFVVNHNGMSLEASEGAAACGETGDGRSSFSPRGLEDGKGRVVHRAERTRP